MSVGEPKMERHHCRLDEQTAGDHAESGLDHRIIRTPLDVLRERREIERARFRIDQTDAGKHHETGERVCDGKIQGAGNRRSFQLVAGERERGDAHHLEPDEQVEEVVRQREADHGGAARGSGRRRCPLRPSKERGVPEERSRHFALFLAFEDGADDRLVERGAGNERDEPEQEQLERADRSITRPCVSSRLRAAMVWRFRFSATGS